MKVALKEAQGVFESEQVAGDYLEVVGVEVHLLPFRVSPDSATGTLCDCRHKPGWAARGDTKSPRPVKDGGRRFQRVFSISSAATFCGREEQ